MFIGEQHSSCDPGQAHDSTKGNGYRKQLDLILFAAASKAGWAKLELQQDCQENCEVQGKHQRKLNKNAYIEGDSITYPAAEQKKT